MALEAEKVKKWYKDFYHTNTQSKLVALKEPLNVDSEEIDKYDLLDWEIPEKINNTIVENLLLSPVSMWDLGDLKLRMKIDKTLLDMDWSYRPDISYWVNDYGGLNFSMKLPPMMRLKQLEVFQGKDERYICDIMRQHFTSEVLAWKGSSEDIYITNRELGGIFHPLGSQKQRINIGKLLLSNSTISIYDDSVETNWQVCRYNTLDEFNYEMMTVIKLQN